MNRNTTVQQKEARFSSLRSPTLPPIAMIATLIVYLALTVGLSVVMALSGLAIVGLIGAVAINLVVLFFVRSEVALPIYLLVAGPSVALSLSGSGILSRLYIGNLLFLLVTMIWLVLRVLPNRKSGFSILPRSILIPLLGLIVTGLVSIAFSHLAPDPNVAYSFPHSNTSLIVTNAAEMMLLFGLPLFLVVVNGVTRTVRHVRWTLFAYIIIGLMYALGTIFAGPLGLTSSEVILGVKRPQVFGSISSGLGILIVLFASIAFAQMLYSRKNIGRVMWGIITLIFCIGVIMTFGRESWIGLFLAVVTIASLYTKNWKMLVGIFVLLLPLLLISGATSFFDPSQTYGSDRFRIWQDTIAIWLHSPIIGIGAGNFQFFDLAYGTDVVGVAHNQYLEVLAEMGIPGFIFLLWTMISVGRICIQSFRSAKTRLGKSLSLAYVGYFVSIIFGGFFTSSFVPSAASGGGTAAFVEVSYRWILLGLVLSIPNWEAEATKVEEGAADIDQKQLPEKTLEVLSLSE